MGLVYRAAQSEGQKRLVELCHSLKTESLPTIPISGGRPTKMPIRILLSGQNEALWTDKAMMYYRDEHFDPFSTLEGATSHCNPGIGIHRLDEPRTSRISRAIDQQMQWSKFLRCRALFHREQNLPPQQNLWRQSSPTLCLQSTTPPLPTRTQTQKQRASSN